MEDFMDITKRIEKRASAITEALLAEEKSLKAVEKSLNKRYSESMENVLNSLRNNMETQENELISNQLIKIRVRQWIIPTVMGVLIVLGLALGTWGVTKYVTKELMTLVAVEKELTEVMKKKEALGSHHLISKTYDNGIELLKKPNVWQKDNGNWIVQFEKDKGQ